MSDRTRTCRRATSPTRRRDLLANVPALVRANNPNLEPGNKILDIFDLSAALSGPIVGGKLWFSMTFRRQYLNQLQVGSYNSDGTQAIDDNQILNGSGKVSWQVNPSNHLHYTFNRNLNNRYHRRSGTFVEDRASTIQDQPTNINQAKWTSILSQRLILDVDSFQKGNTPSNPQKEVEHGDVPRVDLVTLVSSVAAGTVPAEPQDKAVFNASMSYFVNNHDLKFGYQFVRGRSERSAYSTSHFPSGFVARYRSGVPDSVQVFNTPYDSVNYFQDNALYLQDKWKVAKRLSLNLGLRLQKSYGWIPGLPEDNRRSSSPASASMKSKGSPTTSIWRRASAPSTTCAAMAGRR